MSEKTYVVYQLRASDEERPFYIGKTFSGSNRLRDHLFISKQKGHKTRRSNKIIKVLKRGEEVLYEELGIFTKEEEAFQEERRLISLLGRKDLGTGYLTNHTDGGEGPTGIIWSEESKERLSASQRGRVRPGNPDEFGKVVTAFNSEGDPVGVFKSGKEACEVLGLTDKAVCHNLRGRTKQTYSVSGIGYRFRFGRSIENIGKVPPHGLTLNHYSQVGVRAYLDDGSAICDYHSCVEAERALGLGGKVVAKNVRGESSAVVGKDGVRIRFLPHPAPDRIAPRIPIPRHGTVAIRQFTIDGTIVGEFPSTVSASRSTGIGGASISKCLTGVHRSGGGFLWKYAEDKGP